MFVSEYVVSYNMALLHMIGWMYEDTTKTGSRITNFHNSVAALRQSLQSSVSTSR